MYQFLLEHIALCTQSTEPSKYFYWLRLLIPFCTLRLADQMLSACQTDTIRCFDIRQSDLLSLIMKYFQTTVISCHLLIIIATYTRFVLETRSQYCNAEQFQNKHNHWPGRGTVARLVTSVCLMACRRRCRACVRSSSWPSSASRRSLALNISAMCFCRMVFCSSNSTLALRSRRSSASRAVW